MNLSITKIKNIYKCFIFLLLVLCIENSLKIKSQRDIEYTWKECSAFWCIETILTSCDWNCVYFANGIAWESFLFMSCNWKVLISIILYTTIVLISTYILFGRALSLKVKKLHFKILYFSKIITTLIEKQTKQISTLVVYNNVSS